MKPRDLIINGTLAIASITVFFAAIEIGLRVTGLQTVAPNPPKIYRTSDDPRINIELIPSIRRKAYREIVTTNALGFRSPEIVPGAPVIAVLGDSITFGYGLADDETLPARMQELLPSFSMLNTAVPAYQLTQQTAVYETKVRSLDPAAIVVVFYWNDFTDKTPFLDEKGIVRQEGWTPDTPECSPMKEGPLRFIPGQCWLGSHSAFYKALTKLVNIRYANRELAKERASSAEQPESDTVRENDLDLYARQLDQLTTLLEPEMEKFFVIWPDRYMHGTSRPLLKDIASDRGFAVIDLYDRFGNNVPTLGWDTVHPNAEAVRDAAAIIAERMLETL